MDNVTSLPPPPNPCVIKLDRFQYAFFKQSHIYIHSPEGMCIAEIGHDITKQAEETAFFQLREQLCLLEVLFDQITDDVKMPAQAFTGLADIFSKVNELLGKYTK